MSHPVGVCAPLVTTLSALGRGALLQPRRGRRKGPGEASAGVLDWAGHYGLPELSPLSRRVGRWPGRHGRPVVAHWEGHRGGDLPSWWAALHKPTRSVSAARAPRGVLCWLVQAVRPRGALQRSLSSRAFSPERGRCSAPGEPGRNANLEPQGSAGSGPQAAGHTPGWGGPPAPPHPGHQQHPQGPDTGRQNQLTGQPSWAPGWGLPYLPGLRPPSLRPHLLVELQVIVLAWPWSSTPFGSGAFHPLGLHVPVHGWPLTLHPPPALHQDVPRGCCVRLLRVLASPQGGRSPFPQSAPLAPALPNSALPVGSWERVSQTLC